MEAAAMDQTQSLIIARAALAGAAIVALATLTGWQGWLALRLRGIEATTRHAPPGESGPGIGGELADLRERVRRLERFPI